MKIVQINATCGVGSTGKICVGISQMLIENGVENYIFYSSKTNGYQYGIKCSNDKYIKLQALKSRVFGNYGFNSKKATRKIVKQLEAINPDIVHLHNIHGHDCDLEMLFNYFREHRIRLIWTFHDCWAFTGYCAYFDRVKCNKWKVQCFQCVKKHEYSWFWDKSKKVFEKKRKLFDALDLIIVTPSKWLGDMVQESFFRNYPIKIINNGIDLETFRPSKSHLRQRYNLENKKIILGVAFDWDERKGIDVFESLAKRLPEEYKIILVGTNKELDKQLSNDILAVHRTNSQKELAEFYSIADVFVNPTREENYPTVNMESLACGTPVLTFRTGGSPEMLDESCGGVVECNDVDALEKEIIRICSEKPYTEAACTKKARDFDENEKFKEYLELYERINTSRNERN